METYHKINTIYKRDMTNKGKLILDVFSTPELDFLQSNMWEFTEKIDGCLNYRQTIITDKGRIPIGEIVNKKLQVQVLSYNETIKKVEFKKIKHYHKEKRLRDFLCVEVISKGKGNRNKKIICTDNHKFYSNGVWVEAKFLYKNQKISHLGKEYPIEIKQIVLGLLLGDGSIYRPSGTTRGFSFSHSIEQSEYFDYLLMLFGNLVTECKGYRGGFDGSKKNRRANSIVCKTISDFIMDVCEEDNKKHITQAWVDYLTPLSLAIWYMDDGACMFNALQRPRIRIATNGFSKNEVELLQCGLLDKFRIKSTIKNYKGWTINIDSDSSELFFSIIAPYICNDMKYKIPNKYKKFKSSLEGIAFDGFDALVDTNVVSVCKANVQDKYQYDLTVEDNSNYFTTNILVHNTNIRIIWKDKKLSFEGKTDTAQIPAKLVNTLRGMFNEELMAKTFAGDTCLYGEGYGAGINGGGKYLPNSHNFILFDCFIPSDLNEKVRGWYLNRKNIQDVVDKLLIDTVPLIGFGTLKQACIIVKSGMKSKLGDFEAEGLVLKPIVEMYARNGDRIIAKIKCRDFKN